MYFKKRVIKIIIPMISWFLIIALFRVFVFGNLNIPTETPQAFFNFIMSNGILDYYWYLFLIIGIYITIPILSPLAEKNNKQLLKYTILTLFIVNAVIPNTLSIAGFKINQDLFVKLGTYMIFPLIGFYLSRYNIEKKWRIVLYGLGAASVIYQIIITVVLSYISNNSVLVALGYTQFATILYSSAIFCFVRNTRMKRICGSKIEKGLSALASCSFGIYLLHSIIMESEKSILPINRQSFIWRFICPFLTYGICVAVVLLLKKIPLLKRIVP